MTVNVSVGSDTALAWAQAIFGFVAILAASAGVIVAAWAARSASKSAAAAGRSLAVMEAQLEPLIVVRQTDQEFLGNPVVQVQSANPASPAVNASLVLTIGVLGASTREQLPLGVLRETDPPKHFSVSIGTGLQYGQDGDARALTTFTVTAILGEATLQALSPLTHATLLVQEYELDAAHGFDGTVSVSAECERRLGGERHRFDGIVYRFRAEFTDEDLELLGGDRIDATFLPAHAMSAEYRGAATAGRARFL